MKKETLIELYKKERQYQKKIFGNYELDPILSPSNFLIFIETYLNKAKIKSCEGWSPITKKPKWLLDCREYKYQEMAPIEMYEYLVKIFALTGACLEAYLDVDPEYWRSEGINPKWNKEN